MSTTKNEKNDFEKEIKVVNMNTGCALGIRTPTNRVRVCRATVTQMRNVSLVYHFKNDCQYIFYQIIKKIQN